MRPIPWILVSGLLVAVGIVFSWEGQTSIRPVPVIASREAPDIVPSRWPGRIVDPRVGLPGVGDLGGPAIPGMPAAAPFDLPKDIAPPVTEDAETLLRGFGKHMLVARDKGKFELVFPVLPPAPPPAVEPDPGAAPAADAPVAPPAAGPVIREPQAIESLEALYTALEAAIQKQTAEQPDVPFDLTYCTGRWTRWSDLKPVLDLAATLGLKKIRFAVLRAPSDKTLGAITYPFFDDAGTVKPTLPLRGDNPTDGGLLVLKVGGGGTYFAFQDGSEQRAMQLAEAMKTWHRDLLELEDADYADSGRAWTLRVFPKTSLAGIVEGITALRKIGFGRCGIESE